MTRISCIVSQLPEREAEWLKAFVRTVADMRSQQATFFKTRGGDEKSIETKRSAMIASKTLEREVDELLREPKDKAGAQVTLL